MEVERELDFGAVLRVGRPGTWRPRLIKVGAEVVQSRRIVVKLAANWPWRDLYESVSARALASTAPRNSRQPGFQ